MTPRSKFQSTAPASESSAEEERNPRTHYKCKGARAPGRSGKGVVRETKSRHAKRA